MGFLSKRRRDPVPDGIIRQLAEYGTAVLAARREGRGITDPRFDWPNFIGPATDALRGPDSDSAVDAIFQAALEASDRERATVGAYNLIAEFNPNLDDRRFLRLFDDSLEYMRSAGFSSGHLTRYEADRWIATHGDLRSSFDGIFEVAVPDQSDLPAAKPLAPGESRMVALTEPLPRGNAFFAEHRADGKYIVFSEREYSDDDPTRSRYEEDHLGPFESLPDLLRAVGEMFGTPTYWADDDLEPYFPSRRS